MTTVQALYGVYAIALFVCALLSITTGTVVINAINRSFGNGRLQEQDLLMERFLAVMVIFHLLRLSVLLAAVAFTIYEVLTIYCGGTVSDPVAVLLIVLILTLSAWGLITQLLGLLGKLPREIVAEVEKEKVSK
jgi:hypothetical protein